MGKQNFVIEMGMTLDGLHGYPEGSTGEKVFYMMIMQFLMLWGQQSKGATLKDQKMFYKIRKAMDEAIKTKDASFNLEPEEFDFLDKVRVEVKLDLEANEAVIRVNEQIDKAVTNYESKYGKREMASPAMEHRH